MSLREKLGAAAAGRAASRKAPVWEGPESAGPQGGVTFSLLSRWLVCRERARLLLVEGLKPAPSFNHRIEFGNMWHVCEQALAAAPTTREGASDRAIREPGWPAALADYARALARQYPVAGEQIDHWFNVCRTAFPLYVEYWSRHPDVTERRPLLQEAVFDVPYRLPSGRTARLRGKWDAVDLIGGKSPAVYLFETKTKGDVNEVLMKRQLTRDLQTMFYLVALGSYDWTKGRDVLSGPVNVFKGRPPLAGVRYNVVRRPLSGGRGSISRHKPSKSNPYGESKEAFYGRVRDVILEDPGHFFMRWTATVTPHDLARFRRETLDPVLEQLCDWWDWLVYEPVHKSNTAQYRGFEVRGDPFEPREDSDGNPLVPMHWVHPFGVRNVLDEGGATDLDAYLESGSEVGLARTTELFGELR